MDLISNPDTLNVWQELQQLKTQSPFDAHWDYPELTLSIHHQAFNFNILNTLAKLYQAQGLEQKKTQWRTGHVSEDMPQFLLLRSFTPDPLANLNATKFQQVATSRHCLREISETIRQQQWRGYSGQPIQDVVNIGIGGSDLGPRLCQEALIAFKTTDIRCHFISDVDAFAFENVLTSLNPETTLFLVSSKSLTTEETLKNAKLAQDWINHPQALQKQFIAITAATEKARSLGYQHIIDMGSWVIGRYSCCSAINLSSAILLGYAGFEEFLYGAHEMDQHFLNTPWNNNLPIIMALTGIWNINFLNIPSQLLLIYHSRLRLLVDYIQQLDMESNGKSVNRQGQKISYSTGPIVWGGLGNQAHHSYYQHLAQGQHQVAIDFINVAESKNHFINQLCHGRKQALQQGLYPSEGMKHAIQQQTAITHIQLKQLNPRSLGALIALYEHKIFTQAWLWNINPFDQPGVESAKQNFQEYRQRSELS